MGIDSVCVKPPGLKQELEFPLRNWAGGSLEAANARHIIKIPVNVPIEKVATRLK
jgi:hypothetical protein